MGEWSMISLGQGGRLPFFRVIFLFVCVVFLKFESGSSKEKLGSKASSGTVPK